MDAHSIPFEKWSPAGNTTLFFPEAYRTNQEQALYLAQEALKDEHLCAEQAGFIDTKKQRLTMAGGEFCVNASRAFGAHLAFHEEQKYPTDKSYTIQVSGCTQPIVVRSLGQTPKWHVTANIPLEPYTVEELEAGATLITLPGISHILFDQKKYPIPLSDFSHFHETIRNRYNLNDKACVGLIFFTEENSNFAITPLVYVRNTNTTVLEHSCGSGSLALALCLKKTSAQRISQPCGESLTVTLDSHHEYASVAGNVSLLATGTYWLSQH